MPAHEIETVRIAMFTDDQLVLLRQYLQAADIPYELDTNTVTVPEDRARDLYAILERVARERAEDEPVVPAPRATLARPVVTGGYQIASRNRRVAGATVDWIVLNSWTLVAHRSGSPSWAIVGTLGLYTIGVTTLLGRTLGKFAAGTLVIDTRTGHPPGWAASTLRWLMVSWFSVLAVLLAEVPLLVVIIAGVLVLVVYAPIIWDPRGRGWHDRFAGTVVVRARR